MANFVAIYDTVQKRRQLFEDACRDKIALFENMDQTSLSAGSFSAIWAAGKNAPVDTWSSEQQAAIVIGEAIRPGSSERLTAQDLLQEWADAEHARQHSYDGYYLNIFFHEQKGLIIGGDILGLFPIYYYTDDEITLVGSSPDLFQYHPNVAPSLCIEGLTGMLLTMHSTEGNSLWENVRRLQAGYLLFDDLKTQPREVLQYQLPLSQNYYSLPFTHQVELIYERLKEAIARHAPATRPYSLLFSGGRDSRMLGGYLKERGSDITAITFGESADMEMKIAKKVLRKLPFSHKCIERPFEDYENYANLSAQWEHGLHGMNTIHGWGSAKALMNQQSTHVISGIHHDGIMSGRYGNCVREGDSSEDVFQKVLIMVGEWGIPATELKKLYGSSIHDSTVDTVVDHLRNRFMSYSESDYLKAWCFELNHRGRFHHGGAIWKMSFGAWPVIPIIDHSMLELMCGLPCAAKANRHAQDMLLQTYFPELSEVIFDNNSDHPLPIIPTLPFLLWKSATKPAIINRIVRAAKLRVQGPWDKHLYYHRIYNINNEGWMAVRKGAENGRLIVDGVFDKQKLNNFLPLPAQHIEKKLDAASGLKSVLGLFLWLQHSKATINNGF